MRVGTQLEKSLRLIGVLASGEAAPASMSADSLEVFSTMLDALAIQRLTICNQERSVYSLVSGTGSYTIGPGGTFNQARPAWIDGIGLIVNGFEHPLSPMTPGEYRRLANKTLQGQPGRYYFNDNFPLGEIDFTPVPNLGTYTVAVYWPAAALTSATSLNTVMSLPPGWGRMLTYNLAVELAAFFGVPASPAVMQIAMSAMADVKRSNLRPEVLTFDRALSGQRDAMSVSRFDGGRF